MSMIDLSLPGGRSVSSTFIFVSETTTFIDLRAATEELAIKSLVARLYPGGPIQVVGDRFEPYFALIGFNSSPLEEDLGYGSHLAVLSFGSEFPVNLQRELLQLESRIDWDRYARDFYFDPGRK